MKFPPRPSDGTNFEAAGIHQLDQLLSRDSPAIADKLLQVLAYQLIHSGVQFGRDLASRFQDVIFDG